MNVIVINANMTGGGGIQKQLKSIWKDCEEWNICESEIIFVREFVNFNLCVLFERNIMTPPYCTQNDGDCKTCSLVNYGRDCRNVPITKDNKLPASLQMIRKTLRLRWPEAEPLLDKMVEKAGAYEWYKDDFNHWIEFGSTLQIRKLAEEFGNYGEIDFANNVDALDAAHSITNLKAL